MRNRHRIVGAVAVLLISAPVAHATSSGATTPELPTGQSDLTSRLDRTAVPVPWGDSLTVERTGYVTRGGTVTVYGSYRCVYQPTDTPRASILVTVTQDAERHGVGGASAICDGHRHNWVITGDGGGSYVPGPAYAEARLVKYGARGDFVPMPRTVADTENEITLISSAS
uniref:DUF6299 domain-containing protein n=1 Tax=Streptomyces violaceusniger TaxID=68280 RepID=A0A6F8Z1P4_STRVO|nr:hypothetical protein [Streptomyces violaceusniger]